MIKILINNEEVVCNNNISIKEEMLSTSSTILKNCYPKSWELDKDYVSRYYFPKDYSKCKITDDVYHPEVIGTRVSGTNFTINYDNTLNWNLEEIKGDTLQDSQPTPDTPVEIQSVTGLQNIEICGKNLFDIDTTTRIIGGTKTNNIITSSSYSSGSWVGMTISFSPISITEEFTISMDLKLTSGSTGTFSKMNDGVTNFTEISKPTISENWQRYVYKYTPSSNYSINKFYIQMISINGQFECRNIQIEKGTATDYEPYKGNTYEVNLGNIELNKIGDYQDRIYKDNGKWYVEKQVSVRTLNGTENWSYSSNKRTYWLELSDIKVQNIQSNMMDIASNLNNYGTILNNDSALSIEYGFFVNNQYIHIRNKNILNNINNFKTWLASNQVKVLIPLKETTTTEITDETLLSQLENIYNMSLLNGINNITITSENLPMIMQLYYNYKEAYTSEDLLFCGCVKNTGNISLNPRDPHYVDLQLLDFKCLLSEGETLNYVITGKTIAEAINQVVASISDYGFVVGNIQLLNSNEVIGAYSTLNKTPYDVFQYFADITQSRWTTRMIDENTIAIDFYDPTLLPTADPIQSTQSYYENNKIVDISFNYSTNDYRNKQIMTSDEVYGNITQTETLIADGYSKTFMCQNKIGTITGITLNGASATFITKSEEQLGTSGDFIYQPGEMQFVSSNTIGTGSVIVITYYPIIKGREIILNSTESSRISTQIGRKGTISRYENRNDTTSSQELQKIGQSYIKYKGQAEIVLKVVSENNIFNVGQIVEYQAPLEDLSTEYMVKSKEINWYINADKTFYTYELTSNFNYENAINYFDNQRAKNQGNIGEGEVISRAIDLENTANLIFYDTDIEEIEVQNPTSLDFTLDGVLI